MLLKFELVRVGGTPLYTYDGKLTKDNYKDSSILMSGFMEAIQMMSESFGSSLETIKFSDMYVYIKTYGDFSIRLLADENMEKDTLDTIFKRTSTETMRILSENGDSQFISEGAFTAVIDPIIDPYTPGFWEKNLKLLESIESSADKPKTSSLPTRTKKLSKIALVGLEKAGKTSIKNKFFHSWTDTMIEDIKATVGIDITNKFEAYIEERFLIMDFGGQEIYRKQHLEDESSWKGVSLLLYVVDIQKTKESFQKAKIYLDRVWSLVKEVNKTEPRLEIFFHKYDPEKRIELNEKLSNCMEIFIDYKDLATFHLTSIYDQTSTTELIKSVFLLLPDVMLRKMLEERFLDHFEQKVLPTFLPIMNRKYQEKDFQEIQESIFNNAIIMGKDYGASIQKGWLEFITGNWRPKERNLTAKKMHVTRKNHTIRISFDDFDTITNNNQDFIFLLLEGVLTGISKILHMPEPKQVPDKLTWVFNLTRSDA